MATALRDKVGVVYSEWLFDQQPKVAVDRVSASCGNERSI